MQDVMARLFQHDETTAGVTVRVVANYMAEQSLNDDGRWFWVYHIRLENHRDDTVQLLTRHWRIVDGLGTVNTVDGEGVVGEKPILGPGQTHDYVSGCELLTNSGAMEGYYTFKLADGSLFDVRIPHFSLTSPVVQR